MNGKQKKMKALGILAVVTCLALTGCHSKKDSTKQKAEPTAAATEQANEAKPAKSTLFLGEQLELTEDGQQEQVTYTSEDPTVATVSETGVVHACKAGTTRIVEEKSSEKRYHEIKVKKRGMVYPTYSMMKGEKLPILFSNEEKVIAWESADQTVATVNDKGIVKGKKIGATTITIRTAEHTYTCDLQVTKKIKNIIYLTFDDGPNRYTTPKILDILKKNDVKATFFELKPAKKDFDLTKRVLDEGHTLAMHGYQHKYDIVYQSKKGYKENLDKLRNLFFKKFGVWCTLSRFPGGSSNTVSKYNPGVMTRITKDIDSWGYHYFDWNVASCDSDVAKDSADVVRYVTGGLIKGRGNVVLMHDYYKNDKTIGALDKIIKYGKKHGYTFLPLTPSTEEVHHQVNN